MSANVLQRPRVAPEVVPPHVVERVAAEVAQRAEVRGPLVVNAPLVLPQFGHSPEGFVTHVTAVTADSRVQRLVLLHAVAPRGAEGAVAAAVRSRAFVFESHVLRHAALLFAAESAVLAAQTFGFGGAGLLLAVSVENVPGQGNFRFGYKGTNGALDVTGPHAALPFMAVQGSFLTALKCTAQTAQTLTLLRNSHEVFIRFLHQLLPFFLS